MQAKFKAYLLDFSRFRHAVIRQLRRTKLDARQMDTYSDGKSVDPKFLKIAAKVASSRGFHMCTNAIRGRKHYYFDIRKNASVFSI